MSSPDPADLTPEHRKAVADLEPDYQNEWLEAAAAAGWSAADLRRALREAEALARPNGAEREKQLAAIRGATERREEADREWREAIRAASGLKRDEVAKAAGISLQHVWRIRKGTDRAQR